MSKTMMIFGFGAGISAAVARKFGLEGFSLALVARDKEKLDRAVSELAADGITAIALPADLTEPDAARKAVEDARARLGPIHVIHWNVFSAKLAGDLAVAPVSELQSVLNLLVASLLAAVQAALPDLKSQSDSAILVTGGRSVSGIEDQADNMLATLYGIMGNMVGKYAQYKLVALLSERLKADGVYVGQIVVTEGVKSPAHDFGTLDADAIADAFWTLFRHRGVTTLNFPGSALLVSALQNSASS